MERERCHFCCGNASVRTVMREAKVIGKTAINSTTSICAKINNLITLDPKDFSRSLSLSFTYRVISGIHNVNVHINKFGCIIAHLSTGSY